MRPTDLDGFQITRNHVEISTTEINNTITNKLSYRAADRKSLGIWGLNRKILPGYEFEP